MSCNGSWSKGPARAGVATNWNSGGNGRWNNSGENRSGWGRSFGGPRINSWEHGNQLPGAPQPSWIATMAASSVDSAFAFSITSGLCDAASSWVQSVLSRVVWNKYSANPSPSSSAGSCHCPDTSRDSGEVNAHHKMMRHSCHEGFWWECSRRPRRRLAQRPCQKPVRRKLSACLGPRRPQVTLQRVRRCPFACARSPFPPSHGDEAVPPEVQRTNGSSGPSNDAETAWKQVRGLRWNSKMWSAKCNWRLWTKFLWMVTTTWIVTLCVSPCHTAMVFLECESSAELKEPLPVSRRTCTLWPRKSVVNGGCANVSKTDLGEETSRREMVSRLWRKFHDPVTI